MEVLRNETHISLIVEIAYLARFPWYCFPEYNSITIPLVNVSMSSSHSVI